MSTALTKALLVAIVFRIPITVHTFIEKKTKQITTLPVVQDADYNIYWELNVKCLHVFQFIHRSFIPYDMFYQLM